MPKLTASPGTLPKILCLHGAGSSGAIFRVQGRKIFHTLRTDFDFVFLDAPFRSKAGPGMRPVYEDSGPFWRWQCDMLAAEAFDITEDEVLAERDEVRETVLRMLRNTNVGDGGEFVGVMAFSQGARVVTGLLLYIEKMRREGRLAKLGLPELKFAVINSATYPPLFLDSETESWVTGGKLIETSPNASETALSAGETWLPPNKKAKVIIPTLHLHGSTDPWRPESEKMKVEFFTESESTIIEYTGGHQVPVREQDTSKIIIAMRNLAAQTKAA